MDAQQRGFRSPPLPLGRGVRGAGVCVSENQTCAARCFEFHFLVDMSLLIKDGFAQTIKMETAAALPADLFRDAALLAIDRLSSSAGRNV
ncbi:MAG: hypothetical protein MZV63_72095 [Marinilabiliales bacterium]|nr:hypothetical protein [Marinilabiliales bacterium]